MTTGTDTAPRPGAGARGTTAGAGAQPPWPAARPAVATAVVLATAPGPGGAPAAALPWEGATLLRRLVGQLAGLGVPDVHVITRPGWQGSLQRELEGLPGGAVVRASDDLASDLRAVAGIARGGEGGVVLASGEILTQREALAGLLVNPGLATGILAGAGRIGRPFAPRTRSNRGRVLSAGSPFHLVHRPTASFLGVLKVAASDRPALAETAERLAALTTPPLPAGWEDELERKRGMWHGWLGRLRRREAEQEQGAPPDDEELDLDAVASPDGEAAEDLPITAADEAELDRRIAVAREDAVSLLLVGLVRAGVHVGNAHLRKLFWARPLTAEGIDRAAERITAYDEDKVLLDSAVKATDGFFTTFFVSPYSKYLARAAARRGLTPNQITTLSLVIGALAAAAFATGERAGLVAGAVLLQLSFTTDCVDGQLARYTRQFSKLGAWLDSIFDRTKEYAVFAGLAIGASRMGSDVWLLAGAALTLQTVRHTFDFSFAAARHQVIGAARQPPLEQTDDVAGARPAPPAASASAPAPAAEPEPPHEPVRLRDLPAAVLGLWRRLDRGPGVLWIKRVVAFPIGERFAVISITAALFTPHTTFVVLLAWGGFASLYTMAGRVLRSVSR